MDLTATVLHEFLTNPVLQGPVVSMLVQVVKTQLTNLNNAPKDPKVIGILQGVNGFLALVMTLLASYLQGHLNDPNIPAMVVQWLTVTLSSIGSYHAVVEPKKAGAAAANVSTSSQ